MITRRGIAATLAGFLGGAAVGGIRRTGPVPPAPPANGPSLVPTGASRADLAAIRAPALARAERFMPDGPPVNLLYAAIDGEPGDDATAIRFADGRWGRQLFADGRLNARQFGAIGDGKVDDTAALQAFLDAVTTGQHGFIPAGVYRITAPLRIGGGATPVRGFTIEGAGRTSYTEGRILGGTLILLDAPYPADAVLLWYGNAWRDTRVTGLGIACTRIDGARYGILIRSSEISCLTFDHLGVDRVETAFGLMQGTGGNGEFCSWTEIQTWRVKGFYHSDAGQAFAPRFTNCFCYYRAGGTLFRFDTRIEGGGPRLVNFDASPAADDGSGAPREQANTTLFALSQNHNAPIVMVGGRIEHITTIAEIDTGATNIMIHNHLQFIGCEFTTDLVRAGIETGHASVRLHHSALADLNFLNCRFAHSFPNDDQGRLAIVADPACRGSIRFQQCGFFGYGDEPAYRGPGGDGLRVSWADCFHNEIGRRGDYRARAQGGRLDRTINGPPPPGGTRVAADGGRPMAFDGERWYETPRLIAAAAPPREGRFHPGDMCRNTAPAAGRPLGWVCVEGGRPGRWRETATL